MKVVPQVVFWLIVIFILSLVFGAPKGKYVESFYFVAMLLPVIVGTSYFFNDYLVPHYLFKKKLAKFLLFSAYMIIISIYLEICVITISFVFLANYQYNNMIPVTTDVFVLAVTLYFIVFLYGFILMSRRYFLHQKAIQMLEEEQGKQKIDNLVIRVDRKMKKIPLQDIKFFESLGDYVKVHTESSGVLITKEKISKLEEKTPSSFIRIHRSYIVNANKIEGFTKEEIYLQKELHLPISRTYKKDVFEMLKNEIKMEETS